MAISALRPTAIAFHDGIRTVLRFEPDGRVFVRDELVDSNLEIYEAFKAWLERVRTPTTVLAAELRALADKIVREAWAVDKHLGRVQEPKP